MPAFATDRYTAERAALMQRLWPQGIPTLWCPLLTHYTADGSLDFERMRRHLDYLQASVKGYLIPGSTGDGWQLSEAETRSLLAFAVDEAAKRRVHLLIGVLKPDTADMLRIIDETTAWLRERSGADDDLQALQQSSVCGYTVCPPKGRELSQAQIEAALDAVLAKDLPVSLYQLPQVTENEMAPETVSRLAARHPNFVMLKDTSGGDRVASAGVRDVHLVRGAEGDYSRHLSLTGGAYDGFLLSTANVFGPHYAALIEQLRKGQRAEADAESQRIAGVIAAVFDAASALPYGNAFTNANKAMDHWFAHGPRARDVEGPRLHSGQRLPAATIEAARAALERAGLMPARGYL